jgi:hypothetical protein
MRTAFIFLFLLFFLFSANAAFAIGISPSRIILDFEPGLSKTIDYVAINNENRTLNISMYVSGDLADYITLSMQSAEIRPNSNIRFSARIALPDEIAPGKHEARIGVVEAMPVGGMVGAVAGAESQLWIMVPYTSDWIEASLSVISGSVNESVSFMLSITSLGNKPINANSTIEVFDSAGRSLRMLTLPSISLDPNSTSRLTASWQPEQPGNYLAKATIRYGDKITMTEIKFVVDEVMEETSEPEHGEREESPVPNLLVLAMAFVIFCTILVVARRSS